MSHGAIGEAGSSVAASGSATGSYLQLITRNHRRSRRPHRRTNTQTQTASQQVSGSYSESDSSVLGHSPRVSHVRTEEYTDTANCDRHAQKHKSKPTHKQTSSVSAGHTDKPQTYKQTQTYTHAHRRRTEAGTPTQADTQDLRTGIAGHRLARDKDEGLCFSDAVIAPSPSSLSRPAGRCPVACANASFESFLFPLPPLSFLSPFTVCYRAELAETKEDRISPVRSTAGREIRTCYF